MIYKNIESTLNFIAKRGYTNNHKEFLKEISKFLANLLNVNYILIDSYSINTPNIANIEVFFNNKTSTFSPNISYTLKHSPCENVIDKKICKYPNNLTTLFPKHKLLLDLNIESYIGVPLWNSLREPIGLISIMDTKPIKNIDDIELHLKIIAIHIEKILEKKIHDKEQNLNTIELNNSKIRIIESEEKFKNLSNLTFEGILIHDDCIAIDTNLSFAKMFGYAQKELVGQNVAKLLFPEEYYEIIEKNKNKESVSSYEMEGIRKDGSRFYIEVETKRIDTKNNNIRVSAFRNISEKKRIENNLIESEYRYKNLLEQAGDAMYLSDFEGNILEVNQKSIEYTGYSRAELLSMKVGDLDVVTPNLNDQKKVWNLLKTKSNISLETVHKRKDGTIFNIEIRVGIIKVKGESLVLGFARDITKRIKSEAENKKLSIAVEQSANTIIITNVQGDIEYTNPKFTELTGYTAEEVVGKKTTILKSGFQSNEFYDNLWCDINNGKTWKGQFLNKAKNGDLFWVQSSITPIKNEEGKIINFLAIKEDITDIKKAEKKLSSANKIIIAKEKYLNNILQTANEGFWIIDTNTISIDVNIKMCDLLGYKKEEIIGKSIFEFVDKENELIFKNELKKRSLGLSTSYEIELLKGNGKKIICLFKTSPIYNNENERLGSFALVTDISILKKSSNKLKKTNKDLKKLSNELVEKNDMLVETNKRIVNLFEQIPVSILEEDFSEVLELLNSKKATTQNFEKYLDENPDFVKHCTSKIKILDVNEASLNLFGVKNKEQLIKHLRSTNNTKSYNALKQEFLAISNNQKEFRTEAEFVDVDGNIIYALVKLAIINNKGSAIASIIDITQIKNVEKELIISKEKAEESNRLKTEFLNNMSHEIRTPMNGILGFSQLLNNEELTSIKRKYYISIIQNSGNQLLNVIDDILEISRLGTKQVKLIEKEVCLNDLLLKLFSIFDLKAKENKIPLYIKNGLSDKESTILTDKTKLEKIISNLLENALKFTNKGYISFGYLLVNNNIDIFVKDTGIGIKYDKQDIIFERFSQEEKELSKNIGGLGLGLSIAKENTELLGGEISVESTKWKGSTFKVSIPYKPVNKICEEKKINEKEKEMDTKFNILVVEDEEVNYLFIEILLTEKLNLNCSILHAKDGKEAVEICQNNTNIDFVLMDINMPIMNGYDATKSIKKLVPNLPIIAQTAYSTPEDKEKAFNAGCNDFITKPISKQVLNSVIQKYLITKNTLS